MQVMSGCALKKDLKVIVPSDCTTPCLILLVVPLPPCLLSKVHRGVKSPRALEVSWICIRVGGVYGCGCAQPLQCLFRVFLFIHSFSKYLLSSSAVPSTVLGVGATVVTKIAQVCVLMEPVLFLWGGGGV